MGPPKNPVRARMFALDRGLFPLVGGPQCGKRTNQEPGAGGHLTILWWDERDREWLCDYVWWPERAVYLMTQKILSPCNFNQEPK